MNGREDKKSNDIFYLCSLIDYIARKTKNRRAAVVDALGENRLSKIYDWNSEVPNTTKVKCSDGEAALD